MRRFGRALIVLLLVGLATGMVYQVKAVRSRVFWRLDAAWTYARGVLDPVGDVPTADPPRAVGIGAPAVPSPSPSVTATQPGSTPTSPPTGAPSATATPSPTPTPMPASVRLPSPSWDKQGWNNCGPATLALALRFFGWEGDQYDISAQIKPEESDRNVNIDELVYFVWNHASWLNAKYRVGGDLLLLRQFLATGIPVVIEEGMPLEQAYWPGDDFWAGHYLFLTGYDDGANVFVTQDSYYGADRSVPYELLDANWKAFNRVYLLLYRPEQEQAVNALLGPQVDYAVNRRHALETAQAEVDEDPEDAFAWFNLGSNLVFFERYQEAAEIYDRVRQIGVPHRMWRYQFGPFLAYFHANRIDELLALTEYALQITPESEEALLWHGWGQYRQGLLDEAVADFRAALSINPFYEDARYALQFVDQVP